MGDVKARGALGTHRRATVNIPAMIIIPSSEQVGCSRSSLTCHHPSWTPPQSSIAAPNLSLPRPLPDALCPPGKFQAPVPSLSFLDSLRVPGTTHLHLLCKPRCLPVGRGHIPARRPPTRRYRSPILTLGMTCLLWRVSSKG